MAEIVGYSFPGPIVPSDSAATYATHEALFGKGGLRTVQTLTERNAIPVDRLEEGMEVYVTATTLTYKLLPSFTIPLVNGNWAVVGGGGGGIAIGDPVTGGVSGSVLFVDTIGNLGQDNNDLFYDDVNKRFSVDSKETTIFLSGVGVTTGIKFSTHLDNPVPGVTDFGSFFAFVHTPFAQLPSFFAGAKSRGTEALPVAVDPGDILFVLGGLGYDGAGYAVAAQINIEVDPAGIVSGTSMPGAIRFLTSDNGTNVASPKISILMDGKFGIGTDTPVTPLHVVGATQLHGGGFANHDNGSLSIDWQNDAMRDGTFGTVSINWFTRNLCDNTQVSSVSWHDRTLNDTLGNPVVNWSTGKVVFTGDGTNVFGLPTDNTGNVSAATGRVPVDIGGVTKYFRYFDD